MPAMHWQMVSTAAVRADTVVCVLLSHEPQVGHVIEDVPVTEKVPAAHKARTASAVAEQAETVRCPAPIGEHITHDELPAESA